MRKLALIRRLEPESEKAFWPLLARPDQLAPEGDGWTTWLVLGGRGAGKTRAGAEWIRSLAEGPYQDNPHSARAIALVAESYADAREIMIEGPSGILALSHSADRPRWEPSRRRLRWERTGAVAHCFSAEDPEGLRGFQFDAAWSDELCKWRYPEETWSNLQLALRLGRRPRQAVTTTPRPVGLLKRLMAAESTVVARASTYDNRDNLAPAFFDEVIRAYEGSALGRQELLGELVEHVEGALWTWSMIEAARIAAAPGMERVVVAVDPPASAGPDADECGIVVAGRAGETAYVLADYSARGLSPRGWAGRALAAFEDFDADRLVVEVNQGGDMAKAVIAQIDPAAPTRAVRAMRGKRLRAEPVAALYEQGRVRHVGAFRALEDQMTSFTGGAGASPDRLDALVWAITDLMLRPRRAAPGVRRIE
ncbi:DNA-packaging protein [Amphiplicatus metriothermophilus]|uniref:Large terminase phage packaging protein n=1 Tax=Amphiplicatus metriothermophilus TaxID=1519374 RepID=A0A239PKK5_9PROT|nr:terminase family protein [Amphiplicatus metriothermophilus]MBB5518082.1 phage terminase large subunit-like protein [Amphiplicatus metriothermophilus]SNT67584.1 Large terminase phage packaging protein [Amphiplicatus metriothermophilus]